MPSPASRRISSLGSLEKKAVRSNFTQQIFSVRGGRAQETLGFDRVVLATSKIQCIRTSIGVNKSDMRVRDKCLCTTSTMRNGGHYQHIQVYEWRIATKNVKVFGIKCPCHQGASGATSKNEPNRNKQKQNKHSKLGPNPITKRGQRRGRLQSLRRRRHG